MVTKTTGELRILMSLITITEAATKILAAVNV